MALLLALFLTSCVETGLGQVAKLLGARVAHVLIF